MTLRQLSLQLRAVRSTPKDVREVEGVLFDMSRPADREMYAAVTFELDVGDPIIEVTIDGELLR